MTDDRIAFVGTYTDGDSEGVYTVRADAEGRIERLGATDAGENPSFLALHPGDHYLYAVNEVDEGAVTAMELDENGDLERLNQVVTGGGADPCHCTVDATGEYLLVAHYTGGTVAMLPIEDDGTVGEPTTVVEHEGEGVHPERQNGPHPHSIQPGPDNEYAYVPDLGTDRVYVYELDLADGDLVPVAEPSVELPDGAGPRHLDFHPNGRHAYLINELDSTITALERDPETGSLTVLDAVSTLPEGYDGDNITADVHVHPSGEFVYGSNRGHDSVAAFAVDEDSGELEPVDRVSTRGEWPRNFAITPDGAHLLAENMDTDDVVTFAIDEVTGELSAMGDVAALPSPVCLQFRD
ncbi:lactonase family protein [Halomicrobium salinisoli]|uniref:lactonase family protein n=1 Tax=Halomicrobium salinisoli TaxID=2878391 RepID=UPI001CF05AC9|nr:lactonase family protein [Halomicrobium salinisoli]